MALPDVKPDGYVVVWKERIEANMKMGYGEGVAGPSIDNDIPEAFVGLTRAVVSGLPFIKTI
jgi:hypothetical protein